MTEVPRDSELHALNGLGYEWVTLSGPWEWTYEGKRLHELRLEIEEQAD